MKFELNRWIGNPKVSDSSPGQTANCICSSYWLAKIHGHLEE